MISEQIIIGCKNFEANAQKSLYELTRAKMFLVVQRYIKDYHDAEDVSIEAYVKVFNNFDKYRGDGAPEAWIRRIFVNECLMFLRKRKNIFFEPIPEYSETIQFTSHEKFDYEEILKLVDMLPIGCRTVFNLYVFEELQHNEIAKMLDISVSTSKSQYQLARNKLLKLINKKSDNE